MIPSDLVLNAGTLVGYNNNIVIATAQMKIGQNEVNQLQIPARPSQTLLAKAPAVTQSKARSVTVHPVYASLGFSLVVFLLLYVSS